MKTLKYNFIEIMNCNMCGVPTQNHKILGQRLNQSQGWHPKKKTGISTSVMQCTNCDLIYSNPQPIPYNIQDHYGIPPEDYWTPDNFELPPGYFCDQIAKAKKFLSFQTGMKALDVGAGLGKAMIAMENAGFDVYGIEPSIPFYERAIRQMGIKPEKLKKGMVEEVDFEPATFDFISFGVVLEHLYDPSKAITKAMKWLKQEGIMHIEVPSSKYLWSKIANLYLRMKGTNYVTNISPMHSPFHMYEFALKSFTENQKENHYFIQHYQYYPCEIRSIPGVFRPMLKWYMQKTNTGLILETWLRKNNKSITV
jgi:2-polyprenyl-3-methyl-5-hydroxy-6-metoxy-1,4-benzoquinol methylase